MIGLLVPLVPLAGAGAVVALRRRPGVLGAVAVGFLVLATALAVIAASTQPAQTVSWGGQIHLRLEVTGFSRVMVVLVPLIAAPIVAYASSSEHEGRTRLLAFMLAFVGAMLLLVIAADFLTLLVAWELVGALSWVLIAHGWKEPENPPAAMQAFLTTRLGDLGLYLAAGAAFAASGTFDFASVPGAPSPARELIAAGVLLAAAAKSAQVPFSPWLFAAMAGPTPVSALLHSATLVAAGAYLLIRLEPALVTVGWFLPAVALVGIVTALAGGVVASVQTHAKRALAASTSAQYGLMFAAVGAGFPAAAAAQLVAHAAFKSLLFLGAGEAIHTTGSQFFARYRLGRALPAVAVLSGVGALALAAVPPLGAAWSKEQIVAGTLDASRALGIATLGAGFLSAFYAARYQLLAYGRREAPGADAARTLQAPARPEIAGMSLLAAITLVLSVLWLPGAAGLVERIASSPLPGSQLGETLLALFLVAVAFAGVWWLGRRDLLLTLALPARLQASAGAWLGLPAITSRLVVRPVLSVAGTLARFDWRVVDAGVRGAASLGAFVSRLVARRAEFTIDGVVSRLASVSLGTASASGAFDDAGVDGAVEAAGRGVGLAGQQSRRLQTGQSHEYYVIVAAGLAVIALVLVVIR